MILVTVIRLIILTMLMLQMFLIPGRRRYRR